MGSSHHVPFHPFATKVDEDDYQARRAQRLAEADFIEDDGTGGVNRCLFLFTANLLPHSLYNALRSAGDFDGYYDDGRDIFEDEDMLEGNTIAAKRARQQRKGGSGTGTARKKAGTTLFKVSPWRLRSIMPRRPFLMPCVLPFFSFLRSTQAPCQLTLYRRKKLPAGCTRREDGRRRCGGGAGQLFG